jgi:lipopolysaccharide export system permease protein
VVTRATGALSAWEAVDYGPIPTESNVRANVYLTSGSDILEAAVVSGSGPATRMRGVTYYQRDPRGMIQRELRSDSAMWANPGWRLDSPQIFDVRTAASTRATGPVVVGEKLTLDQVALGKVDPDAEPLTQLSGSIKALDEAGRRTAEVKGKWWHKISGPLAALLMPLLGAVAGFGLARSGQLFTRAIIGMALGFAYFIVDNAALAMGSFGGYPPLLAAWAPFLLFFLLGETVLIRTEE